MSEIQPNIIDVTDIQFLLQKKFKIFSSDKIPKDCSNLLATSSVHGVIFAGTPTENIIICPISAFVDENNEDTKLPHNIFLLPGVPLQVSLSCDCSTLAVEIELNGLSHIYIYSVESILNNDAKIIEKLRVTNEPNVRCKEILWNPVQNNILAVSLDNGAFLSYVLKNPGFDVFAIDKSEQAQCACWSPKGKQIVVGFPNGKLVQYKPDLKPARIINCPINTFKTNFDSIAIQWLFNYQFAVVFLSRENESTPCLHIINAPKNGNITAINYSDVCYSSSGPRKAQIFLIHISQWGLLLIASANSMEVGLLGTDETGDTPLWSVWVTTDDTRAELPLTENKEDTFPVGFALELGCTHKIIRGETEIPVMPMIHILSTHGYLVSFNLVNLKSNYIDICSPPRPFSYPLKWTIGESTLKTETSSVVDTSFAIQNNPTSTPVPFEKTKSFFQPVETPTPITNFFGNSKPGNEIQITKPSKGIGLFEEKNNSTPEIQQKPITQTNANQNILNTQKSFPSILNALNTAQPIHQPVPVVNEPVKPLITATQQFVKPKLPTDSNTNLNSTTQTTVDEDKTVIKAMINEEIQNFEREIKELLNRSKNINIKIGTNEESTRVLNSLNKLQDISNQATETTEALASEIRSLQSSLFEAFAMASEANSKYEIYNQADYIHLYDTTTKSQTRQRQLNKLQNMIQLNEIQFTEITKQLNSNWSDFEEVKKTNSLKRMHIPSIEAIYQTLIKQKDIINQHKKKLNVIKNKLGMKALTNTTPNMKDSLIEPVIESLTDSIISMTISDQVKAENSKLSDLKLGKIREALKDRKVVMIKSSRPERSGYSDMIREKKIQMQKIKKIESLTKEVKQKPIAVESKPSNVNVQAIQKPTIKAKISNEKVQGTVSLNNFNVPIASNGGINKLQTTIPEQQSKPTFTLPAISTAISVSPFNITQKSLSTNQNTVSSFTPVQKSDVSAKSALDFTESPTTKEMSIFSISSSNAIVTNKFGIDVAKNVDVLKDKINTEKIIASSVPSTNTFSFSFNTPSPISGISKEQAIANPSVPISTNTSFGILKTASEDQTKTPWAMQSKNILPKVSEVTETVSESKSIVDFKPKIESNVQIVKPNPIDFTTSSSIQPSVSKPDQVILTQLESLLKKSDSVSITPISSVPSSTSSFSFGTTTTTDTALKTTSTFSFGAAFAETKDSASKQDNQENILQNLTICKPNERDGTNKKNENIFALPISSSTSALSVTTTSASVFGDNQSSTKVTQSSNISVFNTPAPSPGLPQSTVSSSNTIPSTGNIFGSSTTTFGNTTGGSIFGGISNDNKKPESGNIFGGNTSFGVSKPASDSPFDVKPSETGNLFMTKVEENKNTFGLNLTTDKSQSFRTDAPVFGSVGSATSEFPTSTSVFGQQTGTQVFGTPATTTTSIFGSPTNTNAQSGGSLFGGSSFGTTSPSSGSIFGGGATNTNNSPGFGSFSQTTNTSGFGGGSSFGQQTSPFATPRPAFGSPPTFGGGATFGGAPTFGGQATFGASPTFGGNATFSSPTKSAFGNVFGNMMNQSQQQQQQQPQQQQSPFGGATSPTNSLFEQLGSSDNAMSFGNLAQNANNNQSKTQFGGSAFTSWRS